MTYRIHVTRGQNHLRRAIKREVKIRLKNPTNCLNADNLQFAFTTCFGIKTLLMDCLPNTTSCSTKDCTSVFSSRSFICYY